MTTVIAKMITIMRGW